MTNNVGYGNSNEAMEPVNFAEVIAQTDVEMQRLGWTTDQGLASRSLVKYLESEPTVKYPSNLDAEYEEFQDLSEVLAKTDVEMQRLGWTPEQGREHLIKTYGKRGRTLLTEEELHEFLKHLQSQPDPIAGF